jgi:hypothetical protein
MIDQELRQFFDDNAPGFIEILKSEGQKYWGKPFEVLVSRRAPSPEADPAVQLDDSPASKDALGRTGFADALAIWLTRLWDKNRSEKSKDESKAEGNSFIMNIYGPWGSGKSSLLNLLKTSLQSPVLGQGQIAEKAKRWIVVEFNAWQHQHVTPVWWPLLDKVCKYVVAQLAKWKACKIWLWEYWWRFYNGRKLYLFSLITCLLALGLLIGYQFITGVSDQDAWQRAFSLGFNRPKEIAISISKILALLGALWSGMLTLGRSLLPGSATSAEMFLKLVRDPLEKIKGHFRELVKKFDNPIIVFIDDLDRCQTNYVVKLLEGIQTLFNSYKVFYVIAADRRWLHKCFETEYQALANSVVEPGCQMGHLFLEKIFQLAVPVPRLSQYYQERYLDYLIRGDNLEQKLDKARQEAEAAFAGASSQEDIIDRLKSQTDFDPIKEQARRDVAIRYSASREVEATTEYYLRKFAPLLEPNPRAMKRLVTAYGVYRALAMHEDVDLIDTEDKRDQFVLWIILKLRWPLLEEYLMENPDKIDDLRSYYGQKSTPLPVKLRHFAKDKDVEQFLTDNKIGFKLDKAALDRLVRLKEL